MPVAWLLTGQPLPDFALLADSPLWLFFGGPLGVAFIVGNILLFPQIGSVHTVIMPIVGQMLMGLLVDHFGLFGYEVLPISPLRLFGVLIVLVATAVVLDIGRGRLWRGTRKAWLLGPGAGLVSRSAWVLPRKLPLMGVWGRLSGHQFTPVCCHLRLVLRCCSFSALCCLAVLGFSARSR